MTQMEQKSSSLIESLQNHDQNVDKEIKQSDEIIKRKMESLRKKL